MKMAPKRNPVPFKKKKKRAPRRKKKAKRATPKPANHQLLDEERRNLRGEAVDNSGTTPRKGMWLIHPERQRCYGQVLRVRRNGDVVVAVDGYAGRHAGRTIYEGGYRYVDEMPTGPEWRYHVQLHWREDPPEDWTTLRNGARQKENALAVNGV
jgi:hypothetical protein